MSSNSHGQAIYVEYLTVQNWLSTVLPALRSFTRDNPHHKPSCYIFDCTPIALWLARFWALCEGFCLEQLDFQIVDAHDKEGQSVFWRVFSKDTAEIQSLILKNAEFQEFISQLAPDSNVQVYLEKSPVYSYDLYGPQKYKELWHVAMMTQIAGWHLRSSDRFPSFYLYIIQRPWMKELQEYVQSYGGRLHPIGQLNLWRWSQYRDKLRKLSFRLIKTLLWRKIFDLKVKYGVARHETYYSTETVRLQTEYYGQLNLDNPACHSDVFFCDGKNVCFKDVLLTFNISIDPIDVKRYDQLKSRQIAAVALSPQSCLVDPSLIDVFRPYAQAPSESIKSALSTGLSVESKALAGSLAEYKSVRNYWEQFFERYNIKLTTSWINCELSQMAMADAIADLGGISTIYQRSFEPLPSPQFTVGTDIIFGFSPSDCEERLNSRSRFSYHLAVGYIGDYRFELLRPQASQLRRQLLSRGARHIIAYFDENTVDDGRWFVGHQVPQENYCFWLEKLLADPQLGIIFKPKKPNTLRRRLGGVSKLLLEAERTGRCFIFEGGVLQGSFPPAAAALAADLAIHDALVSGTAGLESALAGVPTLLMDLEGWPLSPLYRLGGNVVFKDWDSAWQACQDYFKTPSVNSKIGDWSVLKNELDPFNDGQAALRVSQFLKWMLDDLSTGKKRELVMDDAVERYVKQWGKDKVQTGPRKEITRR